MALNTTNDFLKALGGDQWPGTSANTGVVLEYYFDNDTSAGHSTGGAWTTDEQSMFTAALQTWMDVANITFNPVTSAGAADFIVQKVTAAELPDAAGDGNYPGDPEHLLRFNTNYHWDSGSLAPGGEMFETFIHEIGHILGLAHPHDQDNGTSTFPGIAFPQPQADLESDKGDHDLNSIPFLIMGYNDDPAAVAIDARDRGFASTPLAFDIATIQRMYGMVNRNTGATVYTLVDAGAGSSYSTIWDTGGINTMRYDGNQFAIIDLRWATLQNETGGGGFLSHVVGTIGGFTIAAAGDNDQPQVVIDNAIGGFGTDKIFGNQYENNLDGRGGQDTLDGGGGNDTLTGGGDADTFMFEDGWGQDTITDFQVGEGGDAIDLLAVTAEGLVRARNTVDGVKIFISINANDVPVDFIILTGVEAEDFAAFGPALNIRATQRFGDGYIAGATVFADANGNGEFDVGEASDTTDANGVFSLLGASGNLIAFGGTDTSTGLAFNAQLSAPAHSIVITPLTTLIVAGASESSILAAFGLDPSIALTLSDPIAALLAGSGDGAEVFVAGAKVVDTVISIATAIAGLGGDEAEAQQDVFAAIAAAINALGAGETLDLSDPAVIAALVEDVAQQQGVNADALVDAISNAIAGANAAIDDHLANDGASADLLTHVSTVQQEVQSNQSPVAVDDSAHVVKGTTLTGNILTNDSDPDGDAVQLIGIDGGTIGDAFAGKYGILTVEADGSFTYVANKNNLPSRYAAQDSIDYSITDGAGGAASGTLSVLVLGKNQLYQSGINTTLTGTKKGDVLDGSGGGVTAIGDKGADILIGGIGNTLTGNKGTDIFLFRADFGANTITDFDWKRGDVIQISPSVFQTVEDVLAHIHDTVAGAVIDDGAGNVITLSGVLFSQLQTNDFHIG